MPKFGYAVKYNGKFYPANTEIPEPAEAEVVEDTAQEAADAAQEPAEAEVEATAEEKVEAPKKAAKSRKKGDA